MSYPVELILARNLTDHLSTPALVIDASDALIWFNDAAASLVGRPRADVASLGRAWTDLLGCDRSIDFVFDDQPKTSKLVFSGEWGKRKVTAAVTPLFIEGRRAGAVVVLYDA